MKKTLTEEFKDSSLYLNKIDKFYDKYSTTNRKFLLDRFGINIFDVYLDKKIITKLFMKEIEKSSYHILPPDQKKIVVDSKTRFISQYPVLDRLIISILYDLLTEKTKRLMSPYVYSYIQGRSAWQAANKIGAFLRHAREADKKINVYVLHADITSYSSSIPIDSNSIVWDYLNKAVEDIDTPEMRNYISSLIEELLRPVLVNDEGLLFQKTVGIPTGCSLTTLVCNLYLRELDNALTNIPGAFFARYGDDFVFAHTDLNSFREGDEQVAAILERLRLKRNPEKEQRFYLTHAGKSLPGSTEFTGCNKINFLGHVIFSDGTMTLKPGSTTKILSRIKQRIKNAANMLRHLDLDVRGETLCQIINQLLEVTSPRVDPGIKRLFSGTTNRSSLEQIDYSIALMVAEFLSSRKGVRAFQEISYATIRGRWKLVSLSYQKSCPLLSIDEKKITIHPSTISYLSSNKYPFI